MKIKTIIILVSLLLYTFNPIFADISVPDIPKESSTDTIAFFYGISGQMVNAEDSSGNFSSYLGRGIRTVIPKETGDSPTTFLLANATSIIGEVNSSGDVVDKYSYSPYGNRVNITNSGYTSLTSSSTLSINNNPFKYDMYYTDDESGLDYLNARYYSPVLKSFLTEDTVNSLANLYMYGKGNPIMNIDPTGHMSEDTQMQLEMTAAMVGLTLLNIIITVGTDGAGSGVFADESVVGAAITGDGTVTGAEEAGAEAGEEAGEGAINAGSKVGGEDVNNLDDAVDYGKGEINENGNLEPEEENNEREIQENNQENEKEEQEKEQENKRSQQQQINRINDQIKSGNAKAERFNFFQSGKGVNILSSNASKWGARSFDFAVKSINAFGTAEAMNYVQNKIYGLPGFANQDSALENFAQMEVVDNIFTFISHAGTLRKVAKGISPGGGQVLIDELNALKTDNNTPLTRVNIANKQ